VGRFRHLLPGRSAARCLVRARRLLAAGSLEEAQHLVESGLQHHPGSTQLRELYLTLRRVITRARQQELKLAVVHRKEPAAYAELIGLYGELSMPEEARRTAEAYADAHPQDAHAHLLLGAIELGAYLERLDSRSGYAAHRHLQRAVELDPDALKAWILLTQLFWCVGAPRRLHVARKHLERIAGEQDDVQRVLEATAADADEDAPLQHEGLLEGIEVSRRLEHDPAEWPLFSAHSSEARVQSDRALRAVREALRAEVAEEIVVLRSNGTVLAHGSTERGIVEDESGLAHVVHALSRTLLHQVGELDLGALRRCSVDGPFGTLVVGRHHGELVAARRARPIESHRLWERLAMALDTASVAVEREA
jgi:tetratricopeptide (TPR) repeat protein